jgi:hypothetical protein
LRPGQVVGDHLGQGGLPLGACGPLSAQLRGMLATAAGL